MVMLLIQCFLYLLITIQNILFIVEYVEIYSSMRNTALDQVSLLYPSLAN